MEATQRGRLWSLQVCLTRSIIISAVVFGSIVMLLSSGGGGAFTFGHSSMMVSADEGMAQLNSAASAASGDRRHIWNMVSSRVPRQFSKDRLIQSPHRLGPAATVVPRGRVP